MMRKDIFSKEGIFISLLLGGLMIRNIYLGKSIYGISSRVWLGVFLVFLLTLGIYQYMSKKN